MEAYLKDQFREDFEKVSTDRPNYVILSNPDQFRIDRQTVFFGGRDWENCEKDMARVKEENREQFVLCIFMVTVIDLGMFTYYPGAYPSFRKQTLFPKFGWVGFGPHYENPKKLILVPLRKGMVTFEKTNLDEYHRIFTDECGVIASRFVKGVRGGELVSRIFSDPEMQVREEDRGTVFERIVLKFNTGIYEAITSL